ncbi:hypothetical protein D0Z03_000379 [Geotrichum reessii]|nr:hypothetical protein D0Z03_000379 [Galactomyces reessii]
MPAPAQDPILLEILSAVKSLQKNHQDLSNRVESSNNDIAKTLVSLEARLSEQEKTRKSTLTLPGTKHKVPIVPVTLTEEKQFAKLKRSDSNSDEESNNASISVMNKKSGIWPNRITLTTYPGQVGVAPIAINWGEADPSLRGPIIVSRNAKTLKYRNALGAHSGSYSIYQALAVALNDLPIDHQPNFTNAQPPFQIGPHPQWSDPKKIVAMDPFGHIAPWIFEDYIKAGIDIRPTIAITKAHMQLAEIREEVRTGKLKVDGKIVLNEEGDLAVSKVAVEPVWYLPGLAERMNITEGELRRALFEVTGGAYPELITRSDVKIFLPPIGGLTAYIFGDPAKVSDKNARLALRVHDECNGSDVFGSDICTCRPYLIFGISEAVKEAQNGGSGVVIYFRKEGRALGEVTKYLVYNARKRGGDTAAEYFKRTENIAGVKDIRFQFLMPDILHFLGITRIDRMLSMSNMKHDAIVEQGIPIIERVPIPDDLIPPDSRVEIDAKIHAGYFTDGKVMTMDELKNVKGRNWEDFNH